MVIYEADYILLDLCLSVTGLAECSRTFIPDTWPYHR